MNEITTTNKVDSNEQSSSNTTDDDELDENNKQIEECEQEARWLEDVGLEEIAQNYKKGEVIDDEVVFKHTATLTKRQAMSVIKRVNTLNDTIRRKRVVVTSTTTQNDNQKPKQLSSTSMSSITQSMLQQQQTQLQHHPLQRSNNILQHHSLSPQQFQNPQNTHRMSTLSEDIGQIKLISYKGIPTQLKDDEICLIEIKKDKIDGFEEFKTYTLENKFLTGVTNINDMSSSDIENMHNLALLNLTGLFDEYDLNFYRKKIKHKKSKDSGVFGVSLSNLLEQDRKRSFRYRVPYFFKKIIDILRTHGLKTEGIFRVPGSAVRIKNVMNETNSPYSNDYLSKLTVNDIADLLKIFLRELPQPLLTNEYYQSFAQILYIKDIHDKIYGFMNLILSLPAIHRDTLKMLLEFLHELVENCEYNKMNLTSVAVIMAPNLFLSSSNTKKYSVLNDTERNVNEQMIDVVKYLIKYHQLIWIIPNDVIKQYRTLNEQKVKKSKPVLTRLFQQIRSSSTTSSSSSSSSSLSSTKRKDELFNGNIENIDFIKNIKVESYPSFVSMTAGDFVQMLLVDNFKEYKDLKSIINEISNSQNKNNYYYNLIPNDGIYLFEQDGNLISRRIDHYVRIIDIKNENPQANWSVRYWSFYRA